MNLIRHAAQTTKDATPPKGGTLNSHLSTRLFISPTRFVGPHRLNAHAAPRVTTKAYRRCAPIPCPFHPQPDPRCPGLSRLAASDPICPVPIPAASRPHHCYFLRMRYQNREGRLRCAAPWRRTEKASQVSDAPSTHRTANSGVQRRCFTRPFKRWTRLWVLAVLAKRYLGPAEPSAQRLRQWRAANTKLHQSAWGHCTVAY